MNKGVEILIARMETNPEDFDYGGRFSTYGETLSEMANGLTQSVRVLYFLPEEDRTALIGAWNEHMRQKFTNKVMQTLVEDPPQLAEQKKESLVQTQAQYRQMRADQQLQSVNNSYNNPYQNHGQWGGAIGIAETSGGIFK